MSLGHVVKPYSYLNCLYSNAISFNDVEKLADMDSKKSQLNIQHVVFEIETWFGNNSASHIKGYTKIFYSYNILGEFTKNRNLEEKKFLRPQNG